MTRQDQAEIGEILHLGNIGNGHIVGGETAVGAPSAPLSDEMYRIELDAPSGSAVTFEKIFIPETHEVDIRAAVGLPDYEVKAKPGVVDYFRELSEPLRGKTIVRINATANGGGVAMLNPPSINLMREAELDAHWGVLKSSERKEHFVSTKKAHNIQQDVAGENVDGSPVEFSEQDKALHWDLAWRNAEPMEEMLRGADVVIIDDFQPAYLIPMIKGYTDAFGEYHPGINPDAKIIYRNHIHTEPAEMADSDSPQGKLWQYMRDDCGIAQVDAYIAHRPEFVPAEMQDKQIIAPATVDEHEGLVVELTPEQIEQGLAITDRLLIESGQRPLDRRKPHIAEISRYDPSKGKDLSIDLYVAARRMAIEKGMDPADVPDLVMVGNGSVDDPDGERVLAEMLAYRDEHYPELRDHIKIIRYTEHEYANDKGEMVDVYDVVNAVTSTSLVTTHNSRREGWETRLSDTMLHKTKARWTSRGWETRITDTMAHGNIPVITNRVGGMPYQVEHLKSGYIIEDYNDPRDVDEAAEFLATLMTDPEAYQAISSSTAEHVEDFTLWEITSLANAIRELRAINSVLGTGPDVRGSDEWLIRNMLAAAQDQTC